MRKYSQPRGDLRAAGVALVLLGLPIIAGWVFFLTGKLVINLYNWVADFGYQLPCQALEWCV